MKRNALYTITLTAWFSVVLFTSCLGTQQERQQALLGAVAGSRVSVPRSIVGRAQQNPTGPAHMTMADTHTPCQRICACMICAGCCAGAYYTIKGIATLIQ